MSAQFTLDAIRQAADARYGHTEIVVDENTTVKMLNPLRLSKAARAELSGIQAKLAEEGADQGDIFREALLIVSEDKGAAQLLLDAVGDDLAVLAEVFKTYTSGTSVGEASASAS